MKTRRIKKERIGSFKKKTLRDIIYIVFLTTILVSITKYVSTPVVYKLHIREVEAKTKTVSVTPTSTPTPVMSYTADQQEIVDYIKEIFGRHADTALLLLTCENNAMNPEAVNTAGNYPAGSRDIGVFQINEYWQGVNARFLFNWKLNVQMAYQIFAEDNYSFKLWTCGRKLGI